MPVHEVSLADEKAQSTSNTQVIGNTVQRYENFMAHRPTPTIDEGLANKALDFKLKIGNEFCWSIHKETLTEKSTFFKNALESFEGATDNSVTLHHVEPSCVVRMMQFAYFGCYPIGVDAYCTHEAKTVNQTLEQGRVNKSSTYTPLWSAANRDSLLHLKTMCLGEKLGMRKLEKYAKAQLKKAIMFGGRAEFWKAVEGRDCVNDEEAGKAEEVRGV